MRPTLVLKVAAQVGQTNKVIGGTGFLCALMHMLDRSRSAVTSWSSLLVGVEALGG